MNSYTCRLQLSSLCPVVSTYMFHGLLTAYLLKSNDWNRYKEESTSLNQAEETCSVSHVSFPCSLWEDLCYFPAWSSHAVASAAARAGQGCVFPTPGDLFKLGKGCATAAANNGSEGRILLMLTALMQNQISFLDFYFLL